MKRHIPVFAFLLCAFAAGEALVASAAQGVNALGYWPPEDGSGYVEDDSAIDPNGGNLWEGWDPLVFSAKLEKGWKVRHWRVKNNYWFNAGDPETEGDELENSAGKAKIEWAFDATYGTDVYLAVKYDYIKYNLKYDLAGGSGTAVGTNGVSYSDKYALAAAPSKTGYTFGGWKDGSGSVFEAGQPDVGGASFEELDDVHEDGRNVTMTAQWTTNAYTIVFDANGGSGTMDSLACRYDATYDLPSNSFVRTGATFANWNTKRDGSGTSYADGAKGLRNLTDQGTVTLYAQWNIAGYVVTFDNQGADLRTGISSRSVHYGRDPGKLDKVTELPQKSGNDFNGFYEKPQGEGEQLWNKNGIFQDDGWPYDRNVTVYASWTPHRYSIAYEGIEDAAGYPTSVTYGEAIELPVPTKTGYAFDGWNVEKGLASAGAEWKQDQGDYGRIANTYTKYKADAANPVKTIWMRNLNTNETAVVTLKANWVEKSTTVRLDHMGATNIPQNPTVMSISYGSTPLSVTRPSYPDAVFAGYYTLPDGRGVQYWDALGDWVGPDGQRGPWQDESEELTLYAATIIQRFSLAFEGNGATNESPMQVETYRYNAVATLPFNTYGRVGYTFAGWATNALERAVYEDGAQRKDNFGTLPGETNVLFAVWATNTYYIAFDPNGGTGTGMPVLTCKYDQPVTLPAATYSKGIHDFAGWSNDVEKVIYADLSDPVSNLCAVANGTNTLYAVWKSAIGPLSEAMGCDNLKWESATWKPGETSWTNDDETISCAMSEGMGLATMQTTSATTNGTLRFWWKSTGGTQGVTWWSKGASEKCPSLAETDGIWRLFEYKGLGTPDTILIGHQDAGTCYITDMTWTPEGTHPEPTDADKVTISSAAVSVDGTFRLSFSSDARFDYSLLTNANLLINSWGVMTTEVGTGGTITFEPEIIEGQPQMFYRVDTIQRK